MSGSRMGFNLWHKQGRKNLLFVCRCYHSIDWRLIFEDTFYPIICKFIGHKVYNAGTNSYIEWACERCHRYLLSKDEK